MICVSIGESEALENFTPGKGADIAEIRLDLLKPLKENVPGIFSRHPGKLIVTCRPDYLSDSRRAVLLKLAIDSGAEWMDIEIDSEPGFINEMVDYAKSRKCKVILSYHNFSATPSSAELEDITNRCFELGADLAKIACMANRSSDVARLLSLYSGFGNLLAISMGEKGKISRIAAPALGAPFTYASPSDEKPAAPGQMTAEEMKSIFNILFRL